ncbi:MAG TPA: hypothetical protein ENI51_05210 [Candidatus Atribacteria bacterium]|nr:MAG: hypothetical protein DRO38_05045 [Candidatus Bathyarchaeota archaeon]HEC92379.1 hypothetical protein [Candidatus Atribacteria bacterium]
MDESGKRGLQASVEGFAHEHIVAGILMKKFQNVSLVDLPLSPYDIIIVFKKKDSTEDIIRAQVKTAKKSISFIGGTRGGIDREYKSGVKEYKQSTSTSDVVIGIHPLGNNSYDLYFVPTILIEKLNQKSISIKKVEKLKNNYFILRNCKNYNLVINKAKEYGIIRSKKC